MLSVIFEMLFYVLVEILFNGIMKSSKWFKNKNSPRISLEKKEKQ
jgi:hypothetical protein